MDKGILFRRGLFGYKKEDVLNYFEEHSDGIESALADKDKEIKKIMSDMDDLREKIRVADQKTLFYKNDNQNLRDSNMTLTARIEQKGAEIERLSARSNEDRSLPKSELELKIEELEQILVSKNNEISILKNRLIKLGKTAAETESTAQAIMPNIAVDSERGDEGKSALMKRIHELGEALKQKDDDFYRQKQEYLAIIMKQSEQQKQAESKIHDLEMKLKQTENL